MNDSRTFDFPASATFRNRGIPHLGRDSDEQELINYLRLLEAENRDLRLALDIARLALMQRQVARHTDTDRQGFEGIQE